MPNMDGTGPNGKGPKTGRCLGKCDSKDSVIQENVNGCGKGLGRGKGRGKGRCCGKDNNF
ncbi:MAG: DUF5320 domain-containing protein [Candidatus Gracilibacteria bacterium]|nr:DUF5320 domain-containing protein [Candidatus Gracilibacteria bacterium]MDD4530576.1 DUF5320 domain-containing protein [Candidatus Gracilibacteria bacterium]